MTQTLARGKKRPPLPIRAAALEGRAVPVERDLVESRRTKTGRTVIHHTSARKRLYSVHRNGYSHSARPQRRLLQNTTAVHFRRLGAERAAREEEEDFARRRRRGRRGLRQAL